MTGAELLARHPEQWRTATNHPFLNGIREGSLGERAFNTWLVQDYLFVSDLFRFQSRLLSVAPRGGQALVAAGLVALEAELGWFEEAGRRLRLGLSAERHPATAAYREALMGRADDWPKGVTALWTGERAYLEAWTGASPGGAAYREFVSHWTDPGFREYVDGLGGLVDEAGADEHTFVAICGLESEFWAMAWDSAGG